MPNNDDDNQVNAIVNNVLGRSRSRRAAAMESVRQELNRRAGVTASTTMTTPEGINYADIDPTATVAELISTSTASGWTFLNSSGSLYTEDPKTKKPYKFRLCERRLVDSTLTVKEVKGYRTLDLAYAYGQILLYRGKVNAYKEQKKTNANREAAGNLRYWRGQLKREQIITYHLTRYINGVNITEQYSRAGFYLTMKERVSLLEGFNESLTHARGRNRQRDSEAGNFGKLYGGVYEKEGMVIAMNIQTKLNKVFEDKKPLNTSRHYGIEIECFGPANDNQLANKIVEAKLWPYVNVGHDGSIEFDSEGYECEDEDCSCHDGDLHPDDNTHGHELRICVSEKKLKHVVTTLCKILNDLKMQVNTSCGLHVHLDARRSNPETMFKRLVRAEDALTMLVPSSRRENDYCRDTGTDDLDDAMDRNDRYHKINAHALKAHNTIEVRLHSGTINATKILAWCSLLKSITRSRSLDKKAVSTPAQLIKEVKLSKRVKRHVTARAKLFSRSGVEESN